MNTAISQWAGGILAASQLLTSGQQPAPAAPIAPIQAPFDMPQLQRPVFPARSFNLTDYGAKADGTTKNTEAFRKAITACNAAGGGRVVVPRGKWLTGAVHLMSNVNLHLEEGAEIHFSDDPKDYLPPVLVRYQGVECVNYSPLFYARDCSNIAITGRGSVHGHGQKWWLWSKRGTGSEAQTFKRLEQMVSAKVPAAERIMPTGNDEGFRPQFIQPLNCTNVLLEGFTVAAPGPFWTVQFVYCQNVIARELNIQTRGGPNTDGINVDSTRNVLIEDNLINAGDDCICLKSGRDADARRVGRPTENVVVRNCKTLAGHGGVVIGSETGGGLRNVWAHDCDFTGTDIGIRIKTMRGRGGIVENLNFQDITMNGVDYGIHITTFYHPTPAELVSERTPTFRNFHFKNITAHDVKRGTVSVTGLPERPVAGLVLENITMDGAAGGQFTDVEDLKCVNARLTPTSGPVLALRNAAGVLFERSPSPEGASVFLEVKGDRTRNIRLHDCDYSGAKEGITFGKDVPAETKAKLSAPWNVMSQGSTGENTALRVELGKPIIVAQTTQERHPWGVWQFPWIWRVENGILEVTFSRSIDDASLDSSNKRHPPVAFRSLDGGQTWRQAERSSVPTSTCVLRNGDIICLKGPAEVDIPKKQLPQGARFDHGYSGFYTIRDPLQMPQGIEQHHLMRMTAGKGEWEQIPATIIDPDGGIICYDPPKADHVVVRWRVLQCIVEMPDNSLLGVYYGARLGPDRKPRPKWESYCLKSTDQGRTWRFLSVIARDDHHPLAGYTEPFVSVLPDGSLLAVLRTECAKPGPMCRSRSMDGGKTWTPPEEIWPFGVMPQLLTLGNGVTVLSFGRPGAHLLFSNDGKREQWSKSFPLLVDSREQAGVDGHGDGAQPGENPRGRPDQTRTSGYTSLVATGPDSFIAAFDQFDYPNNDGKPRKTILVRKVTVK